MTSVERGFATSGRANAKVRFVAGLPKIPASVEKVGLAAMGAAVNGKVGVAVLTGISHSAVSGEVGVAVLTGLSHSTGLSGTGTSTVCWS